jgi:hypothetical protein
MFNNDLPSLIDGSFNNSLHIFERFFDRGIINENDLNVVIRLFHEKNCPDAANRLESWFIFYFYKISTIHLQNIFKTQP